MTNKSLWSLSLCITTLPVSSFWFYLTLPSTCSHLVYFTSPMPLPIYAIHIFRPRSSIGRFLACWCIRAAIGWHRADIVSKIGDPNTYQWIIWWVLYLDLRFLLDAPSSRNLHRSPQGSWMATHFNHWTVRAFKAGSSRFYTLHVYPVLPPEKFRNGGKHWFSRSTINLQLMCKFFCATGYTELPMLVFCIIGRSGGWDMNLKVMGYVFALQAQGCGTSGETG